MKKRLIILLYMVLFLMMGGCQEDLFVIPSETPANTTEYHAIITDSLGTPSKTSNNTTACQTTNEELVLQKHYRNYPWNLKKALNVLPDVYIQDHSDESLRNQVVLRYRSLESIRWALKDGVSFPMLRGSQPYYPISFGYYRSINTNAELVFDSQGGFMYYEGVPYRRQTNTTLDEFLNNIDEWGFYTGPIGENYLGFDSVYGVCYALSILDPSIESRCAKDLFPTKNNGICKVGEYDDSISNDSTREIVEKNGRNTMLKAYESLCNGDVLLLVDGEMEFAFLVIRGMNDKGELTMDGLAPGHLEVLQDFDSDGLPCAGRYAAPLDITITPELLFENHFIPITHEALIEAD
ncbi:MAG: hypothetical protein E7655_00645 [Ruminococcaceae bacterium]|nr:hypothetical protein [Oscillospiraceae bacterium]